MADYRCPYGYGWCEVPYKDCPHWQGTFCELEVGVREDGWLQGRKRDEILPIYGINGNNAIPYNRRRILHKCFYGTMHRGTLRCVQTEWRWKGLLCKVGQRSDIWGDCGWLNWNRARSAAVEHKSDIPEMEVGIWATPQIYSWEANPDLLCAWNAKLWHREIPVCAERLISGTAVPERRTSMG